MSSRKSHLFVEFIIFAKMTMLHVRSSFMICFSLFLYCVFFMDFFAFVLWIYQMQTRLLQIRNQFAWTLNISTMWLLVFFCAAIMISVHLICIFFRTGIEIKARRKKTRNEIKTHKWTHIRSRWSAVDFRYNSYFYVSLSHSQTCIHQVATMYNL